ncbi:MAG: DUF120 domain-containing protein [Candidatus Altiarchaeota archaeon]
MLSYEFVLYCLAGRLKSPSGRLSMSTSEFGLLFSVSQQTASRYLRGLESLGWVERRQNGRGFTLNLTSEGVAVLKGMHINIGKFLESKAPQAFEGKVVSGIGEGAYYVRQYADRIEEALGYRPYYGTLNIRFEGGKPELAAYKTDYVSGFRSDNRSFGKAELVEVILSVGNHEIGCHAILPERTHHKKDLELIARHNLRRKYGLADGQKVLVSVR